MTFEMSETQRQGLADAILFADTGKRLTDVDEADRGAYLREADYYVNRLRFAAPSALGSRLRKSVQRVLDRKRKG